MGGLEVGTKDILLCLKTVIGKKMKLFSNYIYETEPISLSFPLPHPLSPTCLQDYMVREKCMAGHISDC